MKRLIILGSGNIGKIASEYAMLSKDYGKEWTIGGCLEFEGKDSVADSQYPQIIGTIEGYQPADEDVFFCSYANVEDRKKSVRIMEQKGAQFINIIHPSANVLSTSILGVGNLIGAFTTISVNSTIGNHCVIQDHCNVGHDCVIGDFTHLYVGNIVCGINTLGECTTVYTGSVIYPKLKVGEGATIGAGSVVMRAVKPGTTVMGSPAKKVE